MIAGLDLLPALFIGPTMALLWALLLIVFVLVIARIVLGLAWRIVVVAAIVLGVLWLLGAIGSNPPGLA